MSNRDLIKTHFDLISAKARLVKPNDWTDNLWSAVIEIEKSLKEVRKLLDEESSGDR